MLLSILLFLYFSLNTCIAWYYLSRIAGLYPKLLPVCYERMAQSQSFREDLSQRLDADISAAGFVGRNRIDAAPAEDIDDALLSECRSLYARLSERGALGPCR